jgi:hypothetical protein
MLPCMSGSSAGPRVGLPRRARRLLFIAAVLAASGALAASAAPGPGALRVAQRPPTDANPGSPGLVEVDLADPDDELPIDIDVNITGPCDELDPRACLLPFPNDRFTVADPSTDTGRRVQLDIRSMPADVAGKPIEPGEWNRNDGFSPSSPILTFVPGLDLARTWGTNVDHIADLARYTRTDAPIVLLDATTGQRVPFWSELDEHPDVTDPSRLLILHPAVALTEGHRYVVALRRLRAHDGALVPASAQFRAYRDAAPMPPGSPEDAEARRPHLERLFRELGQAGVGRHDLFLAWDFTVASERNLSERALAIRDDAFARLGDEDLADRAVAGRAPGFTIEKVEDFATGNTFRRVDGTVTVPNYLTPQAEVLPRSLHEVRSALGDVLDQVPDEVMDALDPVTDASPISVDDILGHDLSVPGSRFVTDPATGLPMVDPLQPTVDVPFQCEISRSSLGEASRPMLYGHGLLGDRTEVGRGSTERLRERGWSPCAVDWWGMSFADLPNVAISLLDLSGFASMVDRMQQGFLNFMYLGRALVHPDGLTSSAAFRGPRGQRLVQAGDLAYAGNSQGGIMGGALTALAPDFERAVLGVPGMAYSTLLNRSVDWEGEYAVVYEAAYPDVIDRQLGYALVQMLWDRGESAGYAHHMTGDPLTGTPTHEVFLQVAFADHQVANVAAEVMGRTVGASLVMPALAPGLHWSADPAFGFRTVSGNRDDVGSLLVYWFSQGFGLHTPPNGNLPMAAGRDPHSAPRAYGPATDQVAQWLLHGRLVDVCGGGPCTIPPPP